MTISTFSAKLAFGLVTLTLCCAALGAPTVTFITLAEAKQLTGSVLELTYKITVKNDAIAKSNVNAKLKNVPAGTSIVDGIVTIGALTPNGMVTPTDTFTIRHDQIFPFQENSLVWEFFEGSIGDIGKTIAFPGPSPLPIATINSLPINPETGRPILLKLPLANLEIDLSRRDPISAVSTCVNWITTCYHPGIREIDDCARSVPICKTNSPWLENQACCPSQCFKEYKDVRVSGMTTIDALIYVYVNDGACFPGYKGFDLLRQGNVPP